MQNFPNFFETNEYVINQKVNFFKFEADFKVYNTSGEEIGLIRQKLSASHKILSLIIGKQAMPFLMEIYDKEGNLVAVIKRGWTLFMSEISVSDGHKNTIGYIKQKWKLFKPTFHIMDATRNKIAEIKGDWKGWNFQIIEKSGDLIGGINKKWAGAMKEIFTSADNYHVTIKEEYQENTDKIVIVSAAITIDMVLKQSK